MKRFAIGLIAALASCHAAAALLTFEEPATRLISVCQDPCMREQWEIEGFRIRGPIVDWGPNPYVPAVPYGGRMIASGSSTLIVGPGPNPYYSHIERIDGGDFQLSSVVFSASAVGIAVIGQIPFGAHLFIDGYRDGALLYHLQTPLSAFAGDNSEMPLVYKFDELVNVDSVHFYTTSYNSGYSMIDDLGYNLAVVTQEPVRDEVPLPPTVALLVIGLIGLALRRYGQKQGG